MKAMLLAALMFLSQGGTPFPEPSPLRVLVSATDAFSSAYTYPQTPSIRLLYFVGDTVSMRAGIVNQGKDLERITPGGLERLYEVRATRDNVPIPIGLRSDAVFTMTGPGIHWETRGLGANIDFMPGVLLTETFTVNDVLSPGVYRISFVPVVTDARSRPLFETTFAFEVKDPTPEDKAEILIRRMTRAWAEGQYQVAVAEAVALLEEYPQSSSAYNMLGIIAASSKRFKEAADFYQKAIDLVASGRDTRAKLLANPTFASQFLENLKTKRAGALRGQAIFPVMQ